jgi:hypothetical protein
MKLDLRARGNDVVGRDDGGCPGIGGKTGRHSENPGT